MDAEQENAIAVACHKLRTPLTSAMGFVQLLLRDARRTGDSNQLNSLEIVQEQLRRIAGLIDDLAHDARPPAE